MFQFRNFFCNESHKQEFIDLQYEDFIFSTRLPYCSLSIQSQIRKLRAYGVSEKNFHRYWRSDPNGPFEDIKTISIQMRGKKDNFSPNEREKINFSPNKRKKTISIARVRSYDVVETPQTAVKYQLERYGNTITEIHQNSSNRSCCLFYFLLSSTSQAYTINRATQFYLFVGNNILNDDSYVSNTQVRDGDEDTG